MNKDKIKKKIKRYTKGKILIIVMLILSAAVLCTSIFIYGYYCSKKYVMYLGAVAYVCMVVILIIGYVFNLNLVVINIKTINDFRSILEYIVDIPDDVEEQDYCDSLHIITHSLQKYVYYGESKEDELWQKHLRYLQIDILKYNEKIKIFSSELLDVNFLKKICEEMLCQIEEGVFDSNKLDKIKKDKTTKKYKGITEIILRDTCNIVLVIIVVIKVVMTCNDDWYNDIANNHIGKVFYNTSTDIIAATLAIIALKKD